MKRKLAIAAHLALIAPVLAWALWGSATFWLAMFGPDHAIAAWGVPAVVEGVALVGFLLHVARVPSPVRIFRHTLPFVSVPTVLHSAHSLMTDAGWGGWALAGAVALAVCIVSYAAWRGLETLLTDAGAVISAEIEERKARATATVQRIASEASAAIEVIAAMQHALEEHERRLLPAPALLARQAEYPAPVPAADEAVQVLEKTSEATRAYACPRCGRALSLGQYGNAVRRGRCKACKNENNESEEQQ